MSRNPASEARSGLSPAQHLRTPSRSRSPFRRLRQLLDHNNGTSSGGNNNEKNNSNPTATASMKVFPGAVRTPPFEVAISSTKVRLEDSELLQAARPPRSDGKIDRLTAAYHEALNTFDKKTVEHIQKADGLEGLINILDKKRDDLSNSSWLHRGREVLHEPLKRLNLLMPLGKAFAGLDPTAATAFGIVTTVIGIAVGACGATDTIRSNVQEMLDHVPLIYQCDAMCEAGESKEIYQALVAVYKEAIAFYLATEKTLCSSARATIEQLSGGLMTATSRFNAMASRLTETVNLASYQKLQQIENLLKDHHVNSLLDPTRFEAIEMFHLQLKMMRTDEACEWILEDNTFKSWMTSKSQHLLTFYGDTGCGKTVAMPCIIDYLQGIFPRTMVLYFYSNTQAKTNAIGSIYTSLLIQLIEKHRDLKLSFKDMYDVEKRSNLLVDPLSSTQALERLVMAGLEFSRRPLYIVLDGLDQCDDDTCRRLIAFLDQLRTNNREGAKNSACVKVLISSRAQEPISQLLCDFPSLSSFHTLSTCQMRARDATIARHLVDQRLRDSIPNELKMWLLERMPNQSNGNAIWIDMVIRNIQKSKMRNRNAIKLLLQAPRNLAEIYRDLFERAVDGVPENRQFLSSALEILVLARRSLTVAELTCATAIKLANHHSAVGCEALKNLAQVDALSDFDPYRLKELIGPFVKTLGSGSVAGSQQIAPMHVSLTDWVLLAQPLAWKDSSELAEMVPRDRQEVQASRTESLERIVLEVCMVYLLLDDFNGRELRSDSQEQYATTADDALPGNPYADSERHSAPNTPHRESFDPVEQGFGPLYAYAASYWTSHLQAATQSEMFLPIDKILRLCGFRLKTFANWREQYRRPNCTRAEERDMPCVDPLGVVTLFGSASLLQRMLEQGGLGSHEIFRSDTLNQALRLALDHEDFPKIHVLFRCKDTRHDIFFHEALACYHRKRQWQEEIVRPPPEPLKPEWDGVFALLGKITDSLVKDRLGNTLMCNAARYGCLPLLRHLREACRDNDNLLQIVLQPWDEPDGADQSTAWAYHQSISRATRFSHVETIRFLLTWPSIDRHFRHRDSFGFNAFHVAAQSQSSPETVALLLDYSTANVNEETTSGDTPLNLCAFAPNCNLECVRLLLEVGGADVRGGDRVTLSPLCQAALNGNEALCRLLVTVGKADPRTALRLTPGETPKLKRRINVGKIDSEIQHLKELALLELLCDLAGIDAHQPWI